MAISAKPKAQKFKTIFMKRVIVATVVSIVFSITLFGQTDSPSFNNLVSNLNKLEAKYQTHYDKKEYKQTEVVLKEMLSLAENLELTKEEHDKYQTALNRVKASVYYNLTCTYSLLSKKREAIDAFEKAINLGYIEYRHAKTDGDLVNLRKEKRFIDLIDSIKEFDKLHILKNSNGYQNESHDSLPKFSYQSSEDKNLKEVRAYFNLDSIAGGGDELSKIINILNFIHSAIRHNGNNYALCEFDAIDIYNYNKSTGKGVNCRHLAIALNEMYLSMGINSRYVTCMPKDPNDPDCHVINSVYSTQLQKWLWIDPTFNAYVKDENGNLLSIAEVRERLISGKPLVLNEDANWNNQKRETKEDYLENYMAKNLYWFECVDYSRFNPESRYRQVDNKYVSLLPRSFERDLPKGVVNRKYVTHDVEYFWQSPKNERVSE